LSRVFQAIRIKINGEIDNLNLFLEESLNYLKKGGRVAIISFHSIEDKIVQNFFKKYSTGCVCPSIFPICICTNKAKIKTIIKKGILPSETEINILNLNYIICLYVPHF
ncbi:16S rRNA (cytosine(1402)-N(4))-methyltransferase, partial [Candidatus Marinimicrobia bacterium]|nr:16S rRNA (cytosine(1402)-N(4))-methyltransferase [Candidatus Neomarinimicrobiota bacterium]